MHKKIIIIMFAAAFIATFFGVEKTGSLDDLNLVSFVIMRGKDESGLYGVDFVSSTGSGSDKDSEIAYNVISTRGKSFSECVDEAEDMTAKAVFFGHMKSVFFEESFLAESENFKMFNEYVSRNSYFNFYLTMYVLSDKEAKLCAALEEGEKPVIDFVNNMVRKFPLEGTLTVKYNEYITAQPCVCLPYLKMEESLSFYGTAVINENKLIRSYPHKESKIYKILTDSGNNIFFNFDKGDMHVRQADVKIDYEGGLKFVYKVKLRCHLDAYDGGESFNGDLSAVEKEISEYLTEITYDYIKSLKYEAKSDALGIGRYLYRHDNGEYNKLDMSDYEIFEASEIKVDYDVRIVRNGIIY